MWLSAPIYRLKRRAKLMAREQNIPLFQALNRIVALEGFPSWSMLAARTGTGTYESSLLPNLAHGDMLVIAARPWQGKTRLGLRLLLDAAHEGRRSVLFSLEYTEREATDRLRALADPPPETMPEVVTSNDICANYIVHYLSNAPKGTVAVVDYLQILDQQRTKPPLAEQMEVLKAFTLRTGVILAIIAQVDRSYEPGADEVPSFVDLRLPNPIPSHVFSKACFLNAGNVRLVSLG